MAAPGFPFTFQDLVFGGVVQIAADPGILEHIQFVGTSAVLTDFAWLQLFDDAIAPVDGDAPSVPPFPVFARGSGFWTPPTAAALGQAVIGWKFSDGLYGALSSTPDVLTTYNFGIAAVRATGRGA